MNFAGKWVELENILSEVTQAPKGHAWYVLASKWILVTKYRYNVTLHMSKAAKPEGKPKLGSLNLT